MLRYCSENAHSARTTSLRRSSQLRARPVGRAGTKSECKAVPDALDTVSCRTRARHRRKTHIVVTRSRARMCLAQTRFGIGTRRRGRCNAWDGAEHSVVRSGRQDVHADVRKRLRDRSPFGVSRGKCQDVSYIVRAHVAVHTCRVGAFHNEVPCTPGSVRREQKCLCNEVGAHLNSVASRGKTCIPAPRPSFQACGGLS